VTNGDGDLIVQLEVASPSGRPRWSADGETLILPSGDATEEQRFTRDGAPSP